MNRRGHSKIQKSLKDYLAPIVLVAVFSLLLLNYLFSSPSEVKSPVWDNNFLTSTLVWEDSKAQIVYSKGEPTDFAAWENKVYKTEKIKVASGSVEIKLPNDSARLVLDKIWELRYIDTDSLMLFSSSLWVEANSKLNIDLKYMKVSSNANSVYSLTQNEAVSSIYVLDGVVEVKALNDTSTMLQKWEKLIVLKEFGNTTTDIATLKQPIDDYIKNEDWFIKNNGSYFLSKETINTNPNLETSTGGENQSYLDFNNIWGDSNYIQFANLHDEQQITTDIINVEWQVNSTEVAKIIINWNLAKIDEETKKFEYKNLKLENKANDVVYKVYDINNNLLNKWVITIYFADGKENVETSGLATVENFPFSSSPLYPILSPKQNPYTTNEKVIRVEWMVPAGTVSGIVVNGFKLTKFPQFGTYWSYFANEDYGNLKEWVNLYKIEYLDAEWKTIHENTLTIIKQAEAKVVEEEKIIY